MSRSIRKVISWGKSNNGANNRTKTWGDYAAKKARKEGKPIKKQHRRYDMQTLQDYIEYVKRDCDINSPYNDRFDRANYELLKDWLAEQGDNEESRNEFAKKIYNKDKAK